MTAPDCIINLFIKLGLKNSEEERILQKMNACRERIRDIKKTMDNLVAEIKSLEAEYREVKVEFDSLNGAAQETIGIRLKNILKNRQRFLERNQQLDQELNKEYLTHHNLQLQLDHLHSRPADILQDVIDDKNELIYNQAETAKAVAALENTRQDTAPVETPKDDSRQTSDLKAYFEEQMKSFS